MERTFDIFERIAHGVVWRAAIAGELEAVNKLKELANASEHEFFAIHTPTREIIAKVDAKKVAERKSQTG